MGLPVAPPGLPECAATLHVGRDCWSAGSRFNGCFYAIDKLRRGSHVQTARCRTGGLYIHLNRAPVRWANYWYSILIAWNVMILLLASGRLIR